MNSTYALITGASQGIGKEIAVSLARRGYNILLAARSVDKLQNLKALIEQEYEVNVDYAVVDLSTDQGPGILENWVKEKDYPITILVNNAGYGLWARFDEIDIELQKNMIDLNIKSLTEITHRMIPVLCRQGKAYILNVGSSAAYQAVPVLGVYSATKAYVLSFTRAIRHELKGKGISVSILNPGPTDTGFTERAGMQSLKHLTDKFNMSPTVVAEAGVRGLFKGKPEIIPGFTNRLTAVSARFLPKALVEKVAMSIYKKK